MAKEKNKISYEKMVELVTKEFIVGSDAAFLKKVEKTAKGGGLLNKSGKALRNKSKTFSLCVFKPLFFFMKSRDVLLVDSVNNVTYDLAPKSDWPKFYEGIVKAIADEKNK